MSTVLLYFPVCLNLVHGLSFHQGVGPSPVSLHKHSHAPKGHNVPGDAPQAYSDVKIPTLDDLYINLKQDYHGIVDLKKNSTGLMAGYGAHFSSAPKSKLILFYADWCPDCRFFEGAWNKLRTQLNMRSSCKKS